jgi:hypothetical protein
MWEILRLLLTLLTLLAVSVSAYYSMRTLRAVRTYRRELERIQTMVGLLEARAHLHGYLYEEKRGRPMDA